LHISLKLQEEHVTYSEGAIDLVLIGMTLHELLSTTQVLLDKATRACFKARSPPIPVAQAQVLLDTEVGTMTRRESIKHLERGMAQS